MEKDYQKVVEQFRVHYRELYGVQMDDEILYLLIRINELQKDLKEDIRNLPKLRFTSGWDYFWYGAGKSSWIFFCGLLIFIGVFVFT